MMEEPAEERNAMSIAASCEQPVVATRTAKALLRRILRLEAVIEALGDDVRRQRDLRKQAEARMERTYASNAVLTGEFNAVLAENRNLRQGLPSRPLGPGAGSAGDSAQMPGTS